MLLCGGGLGSTRAGSGRSWWVTGVVAFALFMDYFVYGAFAPLTLYSSVKLEGEAQFGLLYAAYAIGALVATPVFGYLGVRIGLKRSMICGVALLAIGILLFWFAADFAMLFLARLLEGSAAGANWTAGLSLIATYHVKRRVEMMGYALMGGTAGSILGPVAGGSLYQLGGYSLPLALMAALIAIDAMATTSLGSSWSFRSLAGRLRLRRRPVRSGLRHSRPVTLRDQP
jgi:MFS transporter, DHA1 family, solute carrier family 18 (vesicular amine transporter), member 1/2